ATNNNGAVATLNFPAAEPFVVSSGVFDVRGNTLLNTGAVTLANATGSANNVVIYANTNGGGNEGGAFSNTGTVAQGAGHLQVNEGVQLSNAGLYQIAGDGSVVYTGLGVIGSIVNTATGTFKKTAGSGTSGLGMPFANQGGTLDAESGTLNFPGGSFGAGSTG